MQIVRLQIKFLEFSTNPKNSYLNHKARNINNYYGNHRQDSILIINTQDPNFKNIFTPARIQAAIQQNLLDPNFAFSQSSDSEIPNVKILSGTELLRKN